MQRSFSLDRLPVPPVPCWSQKWGTLSLSPTPPGCAAHDFAEVSGTHHTQRHSAKVPKETIEAWSGIQQTVISQAIDQ